MSPAPDAEPTADGAVPPRRVLFACVANSARSQMAEAILASHGGPAYAPASAGVVSSRVHPMTIAVLAELGIDWSAAFSKSLAPMLKEPWDLVVTVCDEAVEACPYIPPPTDVLHWRFDDPAAVTGSEAEQLAAFRRVRDEIAEHVDALIEEDRRRGIGDEPVAGSATLPSGLSSTVGQAS